MPSLPALPRRCSHRAGRVKTLHPGVHGGILARRDLPEHMSAIAEHSITPIDIVVVNLYPFRQTVTAANAPSYEVRAAGGRSSWTGGAGSLPFTNRQQAPLARARAAAAISIACRMGAAPHPFVASSPLISTLLLLVPPSLLQVAVENIDIGGPAMIRAAAKNHEHVTVVVDPADYSQLLVQLGGGADAADALAFRKRCAWKAFQHCATYDRYGGWEMGGWGVVPPPAPLPPHGWAKDTREQEWQRQEC